MDTVALYDIIEKAGITVFDIDLPQTISQSQMDEDGDCYIGIDLKRIMSEAEEKVRIAHEGGHCTKGAFYNRYSKLDIKSKHEHKAWIWAIKILIPKDELDYAVSLGNYEMWELSEYFNYPQDFVEMAVNYYNNIE